MRAERSDLTKEEQTHVRTALRFLHRRFGSWKPLAKALALDDSMLSHVVRGDRSVTARLVFRIARLVKVGIDDLITGRYPAPGACPLCGHVAGEKENDDQA